MLKRWLLLLLCLTAVAYLSLYPGTFLDRPKSDSLIWFQSGGSSRRWILDLVLNILLYLPVGVLAVLSVPRHWWSGILAALLGCGFSYTIEQVQRWLPGRYSSWSDVVANGAGAALGAGVALLVTHPRWANTLRKGLRGSAWRLPPNGALFLGLWVLWQVFPLVPRFNLIDGLAQVQSLLSFSSWQAVSLRDILQVAVMMSVVTVSLWRRHWLWIAWSVVPAQLFLFEHRLEPTLILGTLLGFVAGGMIAASDALTSYRKTAGPLFSSRLLAIVVLAWLVFEEFRPFHFANIRMEFTWMPILSVFSPTNTTYETLLSKLLLYSAAVWTLRRAGAVWPLSAAIPFLIVATGEWTQQYLEGRTPESTDIILVAFVVLLLRLAEQAELKQRTERRSRRYA